MSILEYPGALDWLIMLSFALLAINKEVRSACLNFLFAYLVYFALIFPESGFVYYHLAAALNLCLGIVIIQRHFVVGVLVFALIPTNIIGYLLFINDYQPPFYDNIALTIILLQILTLTIRSLHGIFTRSSEFGILGNAFRLFVVWVIAADSMDKDKKTLEKVA